MCCFWAKTQCKPELSQALSELYSESGLLRSCTPPVGALSFNERGLQAPDR